MKQDSRFPNLFILDHPLIQHKLTHMRDKDTSTRTFRDLLREITLLMGYEITRNLPITTKRVATPLVEVDAPVIAGKKLAIVPVLRAGVGMSDGLLELIPSARVGHIGVYRAEDHRPVEYLVRLPDLEDRIFILCDPMVATGYSAAHAVDVLRRRNVPAENILFLALVAAPEGVGVFQQAHPDVKLYVASLDSHLNEHAYIVPGNMDVDHLDELFGVRPEGKEAATIAGLVSELAGRIPQKGEVIEEDGLRFEILDSTDRRVERVRITATQPQQMKLIE